MKIEVLDKGFVELVDKLGDDLTVVNSARVSFGNRKETFDESDEKLLKYLAKNKHWSPFRHIQLQLHIKWSETVARQAYKHVVGISATSDSHTIDHAWNEISGRYVPITEYLERSPGDFRKQSQNNKQASAGPIEDDITQKLLAQRRAQLMDKIFDHYEWELEKGVAKEQAREVLPLAMYTEVWWTASFQAIMNFINLRDHEHAQYEIQLYAKALAEITRKQFPKCYEAFINC